MKVVIAGSRSVCHYRHVEDAMQVAELLLGIIPSLILSGAARGADALGEAYATAHGLPLSKFPADWRQHGRKAGFRRNQQMADSCDALVALWDGTSSGTKHMIATCRSLNRLVHVHLVGESP